jgi:hypothetical protein
MSDDLYSYLDLSGAEYAYLGHFRDMEYICAGHNELGIEEQIDAGNIPDLKMEGKNTPAESEPGNISQSGNVGAAEGMGKTATTPPASGGILGGAVKSAAGDAVKGGLRTLFDL